MTAAGPAARALCSRAVDGIVPRGHLCDQRRYQQRDGRPHARGLVLPYVCYVEAGCSTQYCVTRWSVAYEFFFLLLVSLSLPKYFSLPKYCVVVHIL